MIIEDLNHLEVVAEAAEVEGGILNFFSTQFNSSYIKQSANASAGNGLLAIGNVAVAANVATPIQANA